MYILLNNHPKFIFLGFPDLWSGNLFQSLYSHVLKCLSGWRPLLTIHFFYLLLQNWTDFNQIFTEGTYGANLETELMEFWLRSSKWFYWHFCEKSEKDLLWKFGLEFFHLKWLDIFSCQCWFYVCSKNLIRCMVLMLERFKNWENIFSHGSDVIRMECDWLRRHVFPHVFFIISLCEASYGWLFEWKMSEIV